MKAHINSLKATFSMGFGSGRWNIACNLLKNYLSSLGRCGVNMEPRGMALEAAPQVTAVSSLFATTVSATESKSVSDGVFLDSSDDFRCS